MVWTGEEEGVETEEDEAQPLISLGLGIGGSSSYCNTRKPNDREKDNSFDGILMMKEEEVEDDQVVEREECRKYSVVRFTEEQVEELNRQMLIYKYMVWGLPVPFQLLLPIWRSFSSSSFPPYFYLYRRSSPLVLAFFCGGFDHRQMMDPEPGRCRRTDGKKWRCHQSVIPNEKYCEKHMHRGSKRSRKLVEASPYSRTPNLINLNQNNHPSNAIRPKFPVNLDQNQPTRAVMRAPGLTTSAVKSNVNNKQNNEAKCGLVANERTAVINQSPGLEFSPKSVLQNDTGMSCPRVESGKNNPEFESRCKRTDGKKWRCKKEVLPRQKYCAQHVNRGRVRSEISSLSSSSSREAQAAYGSTSRTAKFSGTEQAKVDLDTNLNISIPTRLENPRNTIKESVAQNVGSGLSSEATESDESTDASNIILVSP